MPTIQKNSLKLSVLAAAMSPLLGLGMSQTALAANSVAEALKEGDTVISLRARYEGVEVDTGNSDALTLKTRATYTSGDYNGLGMTLEFDDTSSLIDVDYSDKVNSDSGPIIADPVGTGVNQAYISYKNSGATVKYGRQRILLDNQRFVGGVGWRQNEQTYDALSVSYTGVKNLSLFAARVYHVDGILGTGLADHETNLFNAGFKTPVGKFSAYYYGIEPVDQNDASNTMGIRAAGKISAGDAKILYTAEHAKQKEGEDTTDYDAAYTHIMAGASVAGITFKAGLESLGAEDGKTFRTPLATKHKFQGWADTLLGHGSAGIDDAYAVVSTKVSGIKIMAAYHQFTANEDVTYDDGSTSEKGDEYGSEINFVVAKKLDNGVGLSLHYADFSEGDDSLKKGDVRKVWLSSTYKF